MTDKKKDSAPPTQAVREPEDTPATQGGVGNQGGTSQPGPPADPNEEVPTDLDFSKRGGSDEEDEKDKS
ncbi:MAG: hypothetical protein WC054_01125 [Candidatus Nanopelagicales bacterium]